MPEFVLDGFEFVAGLEGEGRHSVAQVVQAHWGKAGFGCGFDELAVEVVGVQGLALAVGEDGPARSKPLGGLGRLPLLVAAQLKRWRAP